MNYPTAHINARPGDFARTVLMPGDPHRSRYIAEQYLENRKLVNDVRGVQGYTGTYRGVRVSVMASGMGMPSMGIYSYELYNIFGVENILRVGTAGGLHPAVRLRDLVIGAGACTTSSFPAQYGLPGTYAPIADYRLLSAAVKIAEERTERVHVGNLLTTDAFYAEDASATLAWQKMGVLAVEMETAALYCQAARAGKRALAICTVSDHLVTGEALDAAARETSFTDMMEVALETAVALEAER